MKNVENSAHKGIGSVNKLKSTLKNTPGGKYYFEISVILRNAILISSMLSSSEVWYNITEAEYRKLEQIDEMLLKEIFNCSSQITLEILYLDLGLMQIRYIILLQRLIYLHQILQQETKSTQIF